METLTHLTPDGIARITLNRPEARNALSTSLLGSLRESLETLAENPDVRVLILTGGEQAFSAGADLKERHTMNDDELGRHSAEIEAAARDLAHFPMPVIAVIRGYALAGGAELALACDMRLASPDAVLGFPEVHIGIFPGAGGPLRLPRLIGSGAARFMLFSGRQVSAADALEMGLVQAVCADPLSRAQEWAADIAMAAPLAIRALKRALNDSEGLPTGPAEAVIREYRESLDGTTDYAEGMTAFAEKRPPRFIGS